MDHVGVIVFKCPDKQVVLHFLLCVCMYTSIMYVITCLRGVS